MALMLYQTRGIAAMVATGLGDDGDDLVMPTRRGVPPFPWGALRYILTSGGDYSADTGAKKAPIHRGEWDGIRYAAMERANYGPVVTAIQRAFGESRKRHEMTPAHWKVLIACEAGMVQRTDRRGAAQWMVYRPERADAVMPYDEAGHMFGIAPGYVKRYHDEAKDAVEEEWDFLHSGYEK